MSLRADIVAALEESNAAYDRPAIMCEACSEWTALPCPCCSCCGKGLPTVKEARDLVAQHVVFKLGMTSKAFYRLDRAVIAEVLEEKRAFTTQAARLSISVGAFGDAAPLDKVASTFTEAWRARRTGKV